MDPKTPPKQPNPADNTLPAKGTPDTQSADANHVTNQPRPNSAPTVASPADSTSEDDASASESETAMDSTTDPTASGMQSVMDNDADPGASNTSNDEPL
jgi:hypothetical protein